MKKLISIILSIALVACMFGMSAMAADSTKYQIRNSETGTVADGKETFDATAFSQEVKLTLGTAASRYAVDIIFEGSYTLTVNNLVWNVNDLIYEIDGNTIDEQTYYFTVKNYSDKDVNASVTGVVNTAVTALEGLKITFTGDATKTIVGNVHGADKSNPSQHKFTATLDANKDPTTWTDVINDMVESKDAKTVTLATFTVNVSMAS